MSTALNQCRAALAHGPLIRHPVGGSNSSFYRVADGRRWGARHSQRNRACMFITRGVRLFSGWTVRRLIDAGEARIDGTMVVRA